MKRNKWKAMFALSACLFVIWWALGTGATLAWFSDTDVARNEFHVGLLKMDVAFCNDIVTEYTDMQGSSKVFNDEALYEPGYTQVVYLKIDNVGDMDFNYKLAVTVHRATTGVNALGEEIYLPNYLRYGVVMGTSEEAVREQVKDRLTARDNALNDMAPLGTWSQVSPYTFKAGEDSHYAALIVYMPEAVDNAANYRGITQPKVELGVTVQAQQTNAPQ